MADVSELARVVAPHFVAGLVMADDRCVEAAPILKWAIGRNRDELREYFKQKGWTASIIHRQHDRVQEQA